MAQYIETIIKIFPVLAGVAGGLWTVDTYFENLNKDRIESQHTRDREERNQLLQVQQPFLEHRFAAYVGATVIVGKIELR